MKADFARSGRVGVLSILWMTLGGWLGSMVFFAAVVAPSAFAVLPDSALAGQVVAKCLSILSLFGVAAGSALALLGLILGRSQLLVVLPLILAALCFASHFGLSPTMAELREAAFAGQDAAARARFEQLHDVSVGLFSLTLLGSAALLVLHTRCEVGRENSGIS